MSVQDDGTSGVGCALRALGAFVSNAIGGAGLVSRAYARDTRNDDMIARSAYATLVSVLSVVFAYRRGGAGSLALSTAGMAEAYGVLSLTVSDIYSCSGKVRGLVSDGQWASQGVGLGEKFRSSGGVLFIMSMASDQISASMRREALIISEQAEAGHIHGLKRIILMNALMVATAVVLAFSLVITSVLQIAAIWTAGNITLLVVTVVEIVQIQQGESQAKTQANICLTVSIVMLATAFLMRSVRDKMAARIAIGGILSLEDYREALQIPSVNLEVLAHSMPLSERDTLKCELLGALNMCASPLRSHQWPFRLGLSWDGATGHVIAEARPPGSDQALPLRVSRVPACICVDGDEERDGCEFCASRASRTPASGAVNRAMLAASADGLTLRGEGTYQGSGILKCNQPKGKKRD
jgi:hypothetical protein